MSFRQITYAENGFDSLLYIKLLCFAQHLFVLQDDDFEYPVIINDNRNAEPEPMAVNQLLHTEGVIKREEIKNSFNI